MDRRVIVIDEVNPETGVVSGYDEYQQRVLVSNHFQDGFTRIPAKNERWMVRKDGLHWFLDKRQEKLTTTDYTTLKEGDARIEANDLHINANVIINGEELDKSSITLKVDDVAVGKVSTLNLKSDPTLDFHSRYNATTDEVDIWAQVKKPKSHRIFDFEFQGGWVNYGGQWQTTRLVKDSFGQVSIEGLIRSGSGTIFILPFEYRPAMAQIFNCHCASGSARIDVYPDGTVYLSGYVGGGTNDYVSLSNISFFTE